MTYKPTVPDEYATPYIHRQLEVCAPSNRADLIQYFHRLAARKRKIATATTYAVIVRSFDRLADGRRLLEIQDPSDWTRLLAMYAHSHAAASVQTATAMLKAFIGHSVDGPFPRRLKDALTVPRVKSNRNIVPLTESERDALLRAAGAQKNRFKAVRDQALLWVLWDAGFRIGEALSLEVGSVLFDDKGGAQLALPHNAPGLKTGPRTVYVVDCVPALKIWLSLHPRKGEPTAPIFFGRDPAVRLIPEAAYKVVGKFGTTAKLARPVWPHLFRHTRATRAARGDPNRGVAGWNDAQMRGYFGWEPSSNMPAYYSHLVFRDMEERVRADANADPLAALIRADPLQSLAKLAGMTAAATLEEYRKAQAIDASPRSRDSRDAATLLPLARNVEESERDART